MFMVLSVSDVYQHGVNNIVFHKGRSVSGGLVSYAMKKNYF